MSQENTDDTEGSEDQRCPFCDDTNSCEHHLLTVDATFRGAEGGELYEAFTKRWAELQQAEEDNPKFNEGQKFDELLNEVNDLADAEMNFEIDQGPGMSSAYQSYYCKTKERTQEAIKRFMDVT